MLHHTRFCCSGLYLRIAYRVSKQIFTPNYLRYILTTSQQALLLSYLLACLPKHSRIKLATKRKSLCIRRKIPGYLTHISKKPLGANRASAGSPEELRGRKIADRDGNNGNTGYIGALFSLWPFSKPPELRRFSRWIGGAGIITQYLHDYKDRKV